MNNITHKSYHNIILVRLIIDGLFFFIWVVIERLWLYKFLRLLDAFSTYPNWPHLWHFTFGLHKHHWVDGLFSCNRDKMEKHVCYCIFSFCCFLLWEYSLQCDLKHLQSHDILSLVFVVLVLGRHVSPLSK